MFKVKEKHTHEVFEGPYFKVSASKWNEWVSLPRIWWSDDWSLFHKYDTFTWGMYLCFCILVMLFPIRPFWPLIVFLIIGAVCVWGFIKYKNYHYYDKIINFDDPNNVKQGYILSYLRYMRKKHPELVFERDNKAEQFKPYTEYFKEQQVKEHERLAQKQEQKKLMEFNGYRLDSSKWDEWFCSTKPYHSHEWWLFHADNKGVWGWMIVLTPFYIVFGGEARWLWTVLLWVVCVCFALLRNNLKPGKASNGPEEAAFIYKAYYLDFMKKKYPHLIWIWICSGWKETGEWVHYPEYLEKERQKEIEANKAKREKMRAEEAKKREREKEEYRKMKQDLENYLAAHPHVKGEV